MALTEFQKEILKLLAANRSPDSVFAGGSTLNRDRARFSQDFDIEHFSSQAVRESFARDQATLTIAGYAVEETPQSRPHQGFAEAIVKGVNGLTLVDWTYDTAVRFYPVIQDPNFGWRLHDIDLAVNKVLAMAGRREARDYYDVMMLHRSGLHLASLAWAACGKDPGLVPELVLDEITRHSNYTLEEMQDVVGSDESIDVVTMKRGLLHAIHEARELFAGLPLNQAGHLYVDRVGDIKMPDVEKVKSGEYILHAARIGGAWPIVSQRSIRP
jgi:hypothetical protein